MVTRRKAPTRPARFHVQLRPPLRADAAAFIAAALASRRLHAPWVTPPTTPEAFAAFVRRYGGRPRVTDHAGFLVLDAKDGGIVGVFNFSQIVRGVLQSAYLGYYGFAAYTRQGLMTEGFVLALDRAFGELGLHRVEVNVRPENSRSIALVERVGFEREGYSRRYLKLAGRWRDHLRFAMLGEDWPARRERLLAASAKGGR